MRRMSARQLPPLPALLCSMISLQFGAALAKGLFPALGAAGTTAARVGLSALIMLLIFRPPLQRFSAEQWRAALPYGLALGLMNLSFYLSLQSLPLGIAVAVEFVGPLGVAVASSRRAADFAWVALAALGIALITPLGMGAPQVSAGGLALALAAAACWAAYIIFGTRVSRQFSGMDGASVGMLCAAVVACLGAAALGFSPSRLNPELLLRGGAVAVLSSVLPYSLEMVALRQLPRRLFSILLSLEPAIAALMGFLVAHEALSARQLTAILCIVAASAGATWSGRGATTEAV